MKTVPIIDEEQLMRQRLAGYLPQIEAEIDRAADQLRAEWGVMYGQHVLVVLDAFLQLQQRGGKRLRAALVLVAYEMCGGRDRALGLRVAAIVELIHAYVLALDDIADRSETRRGGPTVHKLLQTYHQGERLHGDSAHFGTVQTMNMVVGLEHYAMRQISELPLSDTCRLQLINHLNDSLLITVQGQVSDIFNEALQEVGEAEVRQVLTWKTAYYSFWNPLVMGALLAGADPADLGPLEAYAMNTGLSFQIADDILGTFGDSYQSGKSATDDLREGKITLLVSRALSRATAHQKRHLLAALGNPQAGEAEYQAARDVIQATGALDDARRLARDYSEKAVDALKDVPAVWNPEGVLFLRGLARFVASRQG